MNWMDNFLDDVDNGLDLTINGRKDCPDLEDLDEELCKLSYIKDSLPPNRDVIKGYGGIRDEFRRLKYREMTFFGFVNNQFDVRSCKLISMYPKARHMVDEMDKNVLKQDIMYATALLTESYVFDDDSPSPVLKTISYRKGIGIFWRSNIYSKVYGWRYNCWTRYIGSGRPTLNFQIMIYVRGKKLGSIPVVGYYDHISYP